MTERKQWWAVGILVEPIDSEETDSGRTEWKIISDLIPYNSQTIGCVDGRLAVKHLVPSNQLSWAVGKLLSQLAKIADISPAQKKFSLYIAGDSEPSSNYEYPENWEELIRAVAFVWDLDFLHVQRSDL